MVFRAKFEGRPWRATAFAERAVDMEAAARGERGGARHGDAARQRTELRVSAAAVSGAGRDAARR